MLAFFSNPKNFWKIQVTSLVISVPLTILLSGLPGRFIPELGVLQIFTVPSVAISLVLLTWLHEMGHRFSFKKLGIPVLGPVLLLPLGGLMIAGRKQSPQEMYLTAVAGPVTGLIGLPLLLVGKLMGNLHILVAGFAFIFIALLQMLPVKPFDGGHLIYAILTSINVRLAEIYSKTSFAAFLLLVFLVPSQSRLLVASTLFICVVTLAILDRRLESKFSSFCDLTYKPASTRLTVWQALAGLGTYLILSCILFAGMVWGFNIMILLITQLPK